MNLENMVVGVLQSESSSSIEFLLPFGTLGFFFHTDDLKILEHGITKFTLIICTIMALNFLQDNTQN